MIHSLLAIIFSGRGRNERDPCFCDTYSNKVGRLALFQPGKLVFNKVCCTDDGVLSWMEYVPGSKETPRWVVMLHGVTKPDPDHVKCVPIIRRPRNCFHREAAQSYIITSSGLH